MNTSSQLTIHPYMPINGSIKGIASWWSFASQRGFRLNILTNYYGVDIKSLQVSRGNRKYINFFPITTTASRFLQENDKLINNAQVYRNVHFALQCNFCGTRRRKINHQGTAFPLLWLVLPSDKSGSPFEDIFIPAILNSLNNYGINTQYLSTLVSKNIFF